MSETLRLYRGSGARGQEQWADKSSILRYDAVYSGANYLRFLGICTLHLQERGLSRCKCCPLSMNSTALILTCILIFCLEDRGSRILRNIHNFYHTRTDVVHMDQTVCQKKTQTFTSTTDNIISNATDNIFLICTYFTISA